MLTLEQMEGGQDVALDITLSEFEDAKLLFLSENNEELSAHLPPLVDMETAIETLEQLIQGRRKRNLDNLKSSVSVLSLKDLRNLLGDQEGMNEFTPAFVPLAEVKKLVIKAINLEVKRQKELEAEAEAEAKAKAEANAAQKAELEQEETQTLVQEAILAETKDETPETTSSALKPLGKMTSWYMSLFSGNRK